MSDRPPNYCGPHNERYLSYCPGCVREWRLALTPIERALVDYRGNRSVCECKRLIEELRAMETN